ncbi:hypothetical protein BGZ97_003093 [Linnemannia gamsii]|uniref:Uncharacterized protein n=1 Tax=Linnemannia gamsii TaxID=64522 RepID=A0A9P6QTT1_9FUNG|nr:hypothetical protein BGZ97_003093 [Linnemannia gamsii]
MILFRTLKRAASFFFYLISRIDVPLEERRFFTFIVYMMYAMLPIIEFQRLFLAYKPSTRAAQLAFNIWSITVAIAASFYILNMSYAFFVPEIELVSNATFSAELEEILRWQNQSSPMVLPDQAMPLQSTTIPGHVQTVWEGIMSWVPSVLHKVLGFALWTILNQRRQLDHEEEVRLEQEHLLSGNSDLPTPIASAATVKGFKTEAEVRQLRLRVPTWPPRETLELAISLLQSLAGLYILYRKSTQQTQWLFYSICITTLYTAFNTGIHHWNEDRPFPPKNEYTAQHQSAEEVAFDRATKMVAFNAFYAYHLWAAWRLVVDLKARDARDARAKRAF